MLHLVEFIQTGVVTTGTTGRMPDSHRQARDWLAELLGIRPLSKYGLSDEQIAATEARHAADMRTYDALTAAAHYYHEALMQRPEVVQWLADHYGISKETIEDLKIGFAPWKYKVQKGDRGVIETLTKQGFSTREICSTGIIYISKEEQKYPFFQDRVVFPYWSGGRVVYMIGRRTQWTAPGEFEKAKYKKLLVHHDEYRKYVSPCIRNDYLYNEDAFLCRPDKLIVTEGVTDCISLMQHGFPVVSPVTVRIKNDDWDRVSGKACSLKTIYICQDNEISEAGIGGALDTAARLKSRGIETRIISLPLGDKQKQARQQLADDFGITEGCASGTSKEKAGLSPEQQAEADRLLADAKIDVNEFFASGHTSEEFQLLMDSAVTPLMYGIQAIPAGLSAEDRNTALEPVLRRVAEETSLEQRRYLEAIKERFGVSLTDLDKRVHQIQKEIKEANKQSSLNRVRQVPNADEGTCKAAINNVLQQMALENLRPNYTLVAEAAYQWFADNGARFYRNSQQEPYVFFRDGIYWLDASDRSRKRSYLSMLYEQTGLVNTDGFGRTFCEVLANLAIKNGTLRDPSTWLHSDIGKYTVYFNLNNEKNEIARISPEGIEIMPNGGNADEIYLGCSSKIMPIHYLPDVDLAMADRLLDELVVNNLTCPEMLRYLITLWVQCFLLLDFAGTKPMTRFEGGSQSGKTTASKLVTTLIYGTDQQKRSTIAANYSDGAINPLVSLDNIETVHMSDELMMFLLTTVTGASNEKRRTGTDTGTVSERTKCLLNTTGIEPLYGHLDEILTRSFIVRFDKSYQTNETFLEAEIVARLIEHRDMLLSAIMKRTSMVLAMCRNGGHRDAMRLLKRTLGDHGKSRCNDYLALMYLMMISGGDEGEIAQSMSTLDPIFIDQLNALNEITSDMSRESNQIAGALTTLFNAYGKAVQTDEEEGNAPYGRSHRSLFEEKYLIHVENGDSLVNIMPRDLFPSLTKLARDFGLPFAYKSNQQFSHRFANEIKTIERAGFEITVNPLPQRRRGYNIRRIEG